MIGAEGCWGERMVRLRDSNTAPSALNSLRFVMEKNIYTNIYTNNFQRRRFMLHSTTPFARNPKSLGMGRNLLQACLRNNPCPPPRGTALMDRINRWKLADELTAYQIALLIAGYDPSEFDDTQQNAWPKNVNISLSKCNKKCSDEQSLHFQRR